MVRFRDIKRLDYKMNKKLLIYQIGFWLLYIIDIFTTLINPITSESNPLFKIIWSTMSILGIIIFKICGIPLIIYLFSRLKPDKLSKYSKIAFYFALCVNIINVLNWSMIKK